MTQVSSSPQTAGYHHSSHCCHSNHCCHNSHCYHHCYSIQSCVDGDEEICEACGGSGSSLHPQNCSNHQSYSSPQSWSHNNPQNPGYSRKTQGGTWEDI